MVDLERASLGLILGMHQGDALGRWVEPITLICGKHLFSLSERNRLLWRIGDTDSEVEKARI